METIQKYFMVPFQYGKSRGSWPRKAIAVCEVFKNGKLDYEFYCENGKGLHAEGRFMKEVISVYGGNVNKRDEFKIKVMINWSPCGACCRRIMKTLPDIFGDNLKVEIRYANHYRLHCTRFIAKNWNGLRDLMDHPNFTLKVFHSFESWEKLAIKMLPFTRSHAPKFTRKDRETLLENYQKEREQREEEDRKILSHVSNISIGSWLLRICRYNRSG